MSGFLEPSISFSSDGVDLMIPYYKVISNKSDITFAPRHIAKRGSGVEINYRSLHGKNNNLRNLEQSLFPAQWRLEAGLFGAACFWLQSGDAG